jgi:hypothetical protein
MLQLPLCCFLFPMLQPPLLPSVSHATATSLLLSVSHATATSASFCFPCSNHICCFCFSRYSHLCIFLFPPLQPPLFLSVSPAPAVSDSVCFSCSSHLCCFLFTMLQPPLLQPSFTISVLANRPLYLHTAQLAYQVLVKICSVYSALITYM